MKVSIVITVYNAERYLDECLQSALGQTHPDTEIIAVDDGSTDTSAEMLDGYADRIRVLSKENECAASAPSLRARRMSGDRFRSLSADGLPRPHAMAALAAEDGRLDDAAAAASIPCAARDSIGGDDSPATAEAWPADYGWPPPPRRAAVLPDHSCGNAIASMSRRSILARCGPFDERPGLDEDCGFRPRCYLVHSCTMQYADPAAASSRARGAQPAVARAGAGALAREERPKAHILSMPPPRRRFCCLSPLSRCRHGPPHARARRRPSRPAAAFYPRRPGRCPPP